MLLKELNHLVEGIANYSQEVYQHSINVATIAARFAYYLNFPEEKILLFFCAGLLHDIGKTKIDLKILNKTERLSEEEWKVIRNHPELGVKILLPYTWSHSFLPLIKYHHERWDGTGYFRIPGKMIPPGARLLALVDAYEAITSTRPYQEKKNREQAFNELKKSMGSQFEPLLVDRFIQLSDKIINQESWDGVIKIDFRQFK